MKCWKNILIKWRNNGYTRVTAITSFALRVKSFKTKQRIREYVYYFGGIDSVYISFSGGKDSTVLKHIAEDDLGDSAKTLKGTVIVTGKQIGRASCRERVLRLV